MLALDARPRQPAQDDVGAPVAERLVAHHLPDADDGTHRRAAVIVGLEPRFE